MANRCLLPGEESASRFFSRPSASGPILGSSRPYEDRRESVSFRRRKFVLSHAYRALLRRLDLWRPPVLDADSIRRGNLRLIPLLLLPATIPSRDEIHSRLLRRRYSFKRLVFPMGTQQPQQRHEKRLINKLIRFLPIPRRASLGLFFSTNACPASSCCWQDTRC